MNTTNKKDLIYKEVVAMATCFGTKPDIQRVVIYTEHLSKYKEEEVVRAIREAMTTSKFFPSLAELIEKIKEAGEGPINERAVVIAHKIIDCISRFGGYRIKDVQKELGADFRVVEMAGGWTNLCNITNDDIPATRAQLRELAKAHLSQKSREFSKEVTLKISGEKIKPLDYNHKEDR